MGEKEEEQRLTKLLNREKEWLMLYAKFLRDLQAAVEAKDAGRIRKYQRRISRVGRRLDRNLFLCEMKAAMAPKLKPMYEKMQVYEHKLMVAMDNPFFGQKGKVAALLQANDPDWNLIREELEKVTADIAPFMKLLDDAMRLVHINDVSMSFTGRETVTVLGRSELIEYTLELESITILENPMNFLQFFSKIMALFIKQYMLELMRLNSSFAELEHYVVRQDFEKRRRQDPVMFELRRDTLARQLVHKIHIKFYREGIMSRCAGFVFGVSHSEVINYDECVIKINSSSVFPYYKDYLAGRFKVQNMIKLLSHEFTHILDRPQRQHTQGEIAFSGVLHLAVVDIFRTEGLARLMEYQRSQAFKFDVSSFGIMMHRMPLKSLNQVESYDNPFYDVGLFYCLITILFEEYIEKSKTASLIAGQRSRENKPLPIDELEVGFKSGIFYIECNPSIYRRVPWLATLSLMEFAKHSWKAAKSLGMPDEYNVMKKIYHAEIQAAA